MIYDLFLALFALGAAPKILWQKKRFCTLAERFGREPPTGWGKRIWIHAVSVGEVKAAQPLLRKLKGPKRCILVTVTTVTGFEEAKRTLQGADLIRFLPLDFSWIMRRWVRSFAPDLLLFVEGDVWPNLVREAGRAKVKTAVVSGKISERSTRRLRCLPFVARRLFGSLDALCVQNEEHQRRFASLVERPIAVTGNLKLDIEARPVDPVRVRSRFALGPEERVVTLSCTHAPEEEELLSLLTGTTLFLAPRHPERFEEVAAILKRIRIPFCRWDEARQEERVILVDAMGQLPHCYAVSRAAIVAGSFSSKVGGHNVLEPLAYGCPVLFGPHMDAQEEFARLAMASGAGWQVDAKEIPTVLARIFSTKERQNIRLEGGSAERTMNELKRLEFFL